MKRALLVLGLFGAATVARADDALPQINVEVGKTAEVDVGFRRGLICDDVTIITPSLETRDDHNVLVIVGNKLGTTQCKVGTEQGRIGYLYEVHVVAPKKPAPKK